MVIKQYDVYLVNLDPTVGAEVKKTRPCLIISPIEMNKYLRTVMIAPMSTQHHPYPSRVSLVFNGKKAQVALDQIRTVDKAARLHKRLGRIGPTAIKNVKSTIKEILVD